MVIGAGDGAVSVWGAPTLSVTAVEPASRIVDKDAEDRDWVLARFSKPIAGCIDNAPRVRLHGPDGSVISGVEVEVVNNDAWVRLPADHAFVPGDSMQLQIDAGVASTKPVGSDCFTLFELGAPQLYDFTYRGARPDALVLDSVSPNLVQAGEARSYVLSGLGLPPDESRVRLFVGDVEATVQSVDTEGEGLSAALVHFALPGLVVGGQYDLTAYVEEDGLWVSAVLAGAIRVESELAVTSFSPQWGPLDGGTVVTIHGDGF